MQHRSKLVTALRLMPLAASPAAAAISLVEPGTLAREVGSGSHTETGGPLATYDGSNGSDQVKLAGSAGWDNGGMSLTDNTLIFTNAGTITASAGDYVRVDYDFFQQFESSSGGTHDATWDLSLTIDSVTRNASGFDDDVYNAGGVQTSLPRSGFFVSQIFGSDLTDAEISIVLTATIDDLSPPLNYSRVNVPQSSISLTVIPEPSALQLMAVVLVVAVLTRFPWRRLALPALSRWQR